jgi:hypothetical protein
VVRERSPLLGGHALAFLLITLDGPRNDRVNDMWHSHMSVTTLLWNVNMDVVPQAQRRASSPLSPWQLCEVADRELVLAGRTSRFSERKRLYRASDIAEGRGAEKTHARIGPTNPERILSVSRS